MTVERLIVGISGGSGPVMAVRLLQELRERTTFELHLVATAAAIRTLDLESDRWDWAAVRALAHHAHDVKDIAAAPASGSFLMRGMVIVPASMNTVSCLAHGITGNLLLRAADVALKERRQVILVPRETPLHLGHLRSLVLLAEMGACILPPMIAFYHRPQTVEDVVNHTVGKILDQLRIEHDLCSRWSGPSENPS